MSDRTIRNWLHSAGGPVGRPPTSPTVRRRAFREVVRVCRRFNWQLGWRKVHEALAGGVPTRLVQRCLRDAKRLHDVHRERHAARHRVHVEVLAANVLWHQDATHLGRVGRRAVQGDVVRDAAAKDVLVASVGGVLTADDAVANLEAAIAAAGAAPLVASTDNGSPYASAEYDACLRRHRIVHLRNLPHTPQHNARGERIIRDLKEKSDLGRDIALPNADEAAGRVAAACARLAARARISREPPPPAVRYTSDQREHLYEAVCCRVASAVLSTAGARARRLAEREAIHAVLEERGLIRRTRGGAPLLPSKAEINS